ncbi:MAG TPA: methyltransferase domain-containing protein [Chloroflexota bacterium]|jgi:SAM-dependent methyltransferase
MTITLACPTCRGALVDLHCPTCDTTYRHVDGIWRFLLPDRAALYAQFEREYHTVRDAEGWGSDDPAYYRALPWHDRSGRFTDLWRIRATSYQAFLTEVLSPLGASLNIVDLGAGSGWLSYRLAQRGHQVAAVDVQTDARDGLGAWRHYDASFMPIQAEFDRLPLAEGQVDVVVYNGSLHYSTDYGTTLQEALRVLKPSGVIAVLDSPMYPACASGAAMVDERRARFQHTYGFSSDALASEHYLTPGRLAQLGLRWRVITPFRGWRWAVRPWWARLRGRRTPADFPVLAGSRA